MRYVGQGHEVAVPVTATDFGPSDVAALKSAFETAYRAQFGLTIPDVEIEVMNWSLSLSTWPEVPAGAPPPPPCAVPEPRSRRAVFDAAAADFVDVPVYDREALKPGCTVSGPALITEAQTTTVVSSPFDASIDALGYIVLDRRTAE
jgi:N-methylhydantoinase A